MKRRTFITLLAASSLAGCARPVHATIRGLTMGTSYAVELAELRDSALWRLKAMVDEAAAQGKDLVAEMVARLKRDIMVARNRLDAIQWRP